MKLLKRITSKAPGRSIYRKTAPSPTLAGRNEKLILEAASLEDPTTTDASDRDASRSLLKVKVHFDETMNQMYEPASDSQTEEYDGSLTWYRKDELSSFYDQVQEEARFMAARESGWAKDLTRAYQAYSRVESAHDMNIIFSAMTAAKEQPFNEHCVGLEQFAIPALKAAQHERRQALMAQIQRLQLCRGVDKMSRSERARRVRKLSHETSRPGRLFAMHVAQLVVESE